MSLIEAVTGHATLQHLDISENEACDDILHDCGAALGGLVAADSPALVTLLLITVLCATQGSPRW